MKKVFSKVTKEVVLPVIVAGGFLSGAYAYTMITDNETDERDVTEYKDVIEQSLENSPYKKYLKGLHKVDNEVKYQVKLKEETEKKRVVEMKARIAAEIARVKEKDRQRELAKQKAIQVAKQKELQRLQEKKTVTQVSNKNTATSANNKQVDTSNQSGWMTINASYYGANCYKCSGKTATGIDVRNTIYYNGYRIIATDPKVIPLWSIVEVQTPYGMFKAVSLDTGGRIVNNHVDILVGSEAESSKYGRHNAKLRIIGSLK